MRKHVAGLVALLVLLWCGQAEAAEPEEEDRLASVPNLAGPSGFVPRQVTTSSSTITVYGRLQYQQTSGLIRPVRYALAELWEDIDLWPDSLVGSTLTDEGGCFAFTLNSLSSRKLYVKVNARSAVVDVKDDAGILSSTYIERFPETSYVVYPGGSYDFGNWWAPSSRQYWEAYDVATDEYQWVKSNAGGWYRSQVTVRFPSGDWPHYDQSVDEIHLPYQSVAPWDRYAVLHEYAHSIMFAAYSPWSVDCPGVDPQQHWPSRTSCEAFAMVEGFAEFMQSAVDNQEGNLWAYSHCQTGSVESIEKNTWHRGDYCSAQESGSIIEGAVASILWDILDTHNQAGGDPDRDNLSLGFDEIWYIMSTYKPATINEFWTRWFTTYPYRSEMAAIFTDHGVPREIPTATPTSAIPVPTLTPTASVPVVPTATPTASCTPSPIPSLGSRVYLPSVANALVGGW